MLALDAVIVLAALSFAMAAGFGSLTEYVYVDGAHETAPGVLTHVDGTPITNLFPYDEAGRLLDGVLLYDQDGRPVVVDGDVHDYPGQATDLYTEDGRSLDTQYPVDANGAKVFNVYPLEQLVEDWRAGPDGSQQVVDAPVLPPAITTPRLAPNPTASTTATSTTSTTTTPSTTSTNAPAESAFPAPGAAPPASGD